jgi:hypothetical protein
MLTTLVTTLENILRSAGEKETTTKGHSSFDEALN